MLADGTATRARLRELMIGAYRAYVTENANAFGAAIEAIVLAESPAVLVHCTAGKDRTGFIVALLQRALAVPEETVIADYLRTNTDWDRASVSSHLPLDHDGVQAILAADADYLAAAFEEIARFDGSAAAFVHRTTGGRVSDHHLSRLVEQEAQP